MQEVYQALWNLGSCQAALLSLPPRFTLSLVCTFFVYWFHPFRDKGQGR